MSTSSACAQGQLQRPHTGSNAHVKSHNRESKETHQATSAGVSLPMFCASIGNRKQRFCVVCVVLQRNTGARARLAVVRSRRYFCKVQRSFTCTLKHLWSFIGFFLIMCTWCLRAHLSHCQPRRRQIAVEHAGIGFLLLDGL